MKNSILILVLFSAVIAVIFLLPTPQKTANVNDRQIDQIDGQLSNTFQLSNITYFDGHQWHENSSLSIENGRIVDSLSTDQTAVIDGNNGYVIPGLIDAHTHTWSNALEQALRFGVTTELDMFSDFKLVQAAKLTRDDTQATQSADFYSAGTLVTSTGGHGTEYGIPIPTLDNADNAETFIKDRIDEGSDYIKIVYNHQPQYYNLTSFDKQVLTAAIDATHKYNKLAVVHISNHQSAIDAVESGADGLVHTFADQVISEDLLKSLKEHDVFVIPTLSVIASMTQSTHSQELANDTHLSEKLSPSMRELLKPFQGMSANPKGMEIAIENTRLMHEYGVQILAGTDAPNPGTAHGVSMHGELELLVASGLTPTEALQSAGIHSAARFPIGNRGNLMTGSKADFILLSQDPRSDIKHTRQFTQVWKNGFAIDSSLPQNNASVSLPSDGLLSDFSDQNLLSTLNQPFTATSDKMMQGQSQAQISWVESGCENTGALQVNGEVKKGFLYPWAGAFIGFSADLMESMDLSKANKLQFSVAGDPGTYQLMVFTLNNMQPAQLPFEISQSCKTINLLMADHSGINWANVTGFAWTADRNRLSDEKAQFTFKLDSIIIQ